MKKNTKGAIAVGAAALLLAGGAGTMAAWSDSASLDGGAVTSGELRITEVGPGSWAWATPGGATGAFNPETDRIVPGDVVAYTAAYDLSVVGTNLRASIEADIDGIDVSGVLATYLDAETNVTFEGTDLEVITPSNNGDTITVTTTITFDPETSGQDGMGKVADLSGATITLQQTAPAAPPTTTVVVDDDNN